MVYYIIVLPIRKALFEKVKERTPKYGFGCAGKKFAKTVQKQLLETKLCDILKKILPCAKQGAEESAEILNISFHSACVLNRRRNLKQKRLAKRVMAAELMDELLAEGTAQWSWEALSSIVPTLSGMD